MKPLLSASQLASIQKTAMAGMQTEVTIKRPVFSSDELGDDAFDSDPQVVAIVKGYLRQTGGDTTGGLDLGAVVTTSLFELSIPLGTDIKARDIVIAHGKEFWVQDVLDDETWPAMLDVTLRRRE